MFRTPNGFKVQVLPSPHHTTTTKKTTGETQQKEITAIHKAHDDRVEDIFKKIKYGMSHINCQPSFY